MRDFTWCRQEIAEDCRWGGGHVHICITGPEGRKITPICGQKALNLFFHDLDPEAIKRTEAYAKNPAIGEDLITKCFTEDQARQMVAFVKSTDEDETIIINCEAGISRSPGAVLAFRRFYGDPFAEDVFNKAHPNIHVTSTLTRVLRE